MSKDLEEVSHTSYLPRDKHKGWEHPGEGSRKVTQWAKQAETRSYVNLGDQLYHIENMTLLESFRQMCATFSAGGICERMKGNKVVKAKTTERKLLCKLKEPVLGDNNSYGS